MKRLLALTLSISFSLLSQAGFLKSKTKEGTSFQFSFNDSNIEKVTLHNTDFSNVKLNVPEKYLGIHYKQGAPALPVIRLYFYGEATVSEQNSIEFSKQSLPLAIRPNLAPIPKTKEAQAALALDASIYNSNKTYPQITKRWKVENAGKIRGQQRKLLTLYPVTYRGKSSELNWVSSFKVDIQESPTPQSETQASFVFVTAERFANSPALQEYMDWKAAQGFKTSKVVIGSEVKTSDDIRGALKKIYDSENLQFALLVGDIEDLPSWEGAGIVGPSDHYYRVLDTDDYSSDINGPDIGLGRVSARGEEELAGIFEKQQRYATQKSSTAQKKTTAFLATNDRWQIAEGTHNYVVETHTQKRDYRGIFPNDMQLGGDLLYAISHRVPTNVVQQVLQMGRAIVNYSGHGARTFWDAPRVNQSDVRALPDSGDFPFVISNACITGDFRVEESFAETWQRHPFGSIAFWGSVDNTYWDEDDILERRMYDGVYLEGNSKFSEITQYALAEHWRHYGGEGLSRYYWETYTLFGDPSLDLQIAR